MAAGVTYVRTIASAVTRAGLVVAGVGLDGSTTFAVLPGHERQHHPSGSGPWSPEAIPLGLQLPPLQHSGTLRCNHRGDALLSVGPAGVFAFVLPPAASWSVEALSPPAPT